MQKHYKEKPCIIMDNTIFNSTWRKKAVISAGNKTIKATILNKPSISYLQNSLYLNRAAAKKLMLPNDQMFKYLIIQNTPLTIRLGPLVGILSTVPCKNGLPFGKEARLFEEMITFASKQGILMFIFYAHEIDWNHATVKGYTCSHNEPDRIRWISRIFPLPDIVYNRIRYRKIENKPNIQIALKKLANHPDIYLFNSRFLDKWEVHEAINSDIKVAQFLPFTKPYSQNNLYLLTSLYSEVFLKPRNSSVGKGIIKVIKQADDVFQYQLVDQNKNILVKNTNGNSLYNELKKYIQNPKEYLVQQGIDLARLHDNVFDLRTQVQKSKDGIWRLTGVGVRVATDKRFLTHLPNGGQTATYHDVIAHTFGNSNNIKNKINRQIQKILKNVPECLEKKLSLNLAVLSIDIGVDSTGKLWIIEVNSKPASFEEDAIRQKHLQYFIDYCLFIASQRQKKEDQI